MSSGEKRVQHKVSNDTFKEKTCYLIKKTIWYTEMPRVTYGSVAIELRVVWEREKK